MIRYELLRAEVARHPYPLLFANISGAHLYGFPSPDSDSDYDLRRVHVLPASEAVGLLPEGGTIEVSGVRNHTIDIEQRFDALRVLFFETVPIARLQSEIMMAVVVGDGRRSTCICTRTIEANLVNVNEEFRLPFLPN